LFFDQSKLLILLIIVNIILKMLDL